MSMEKNRIRPIAGTKVMRMSYSRQEEVLEMPNLIEVQKDSYQWFLDEGLKEVFDDISPIADYSGSLSLEFVDFELCRSILSKSVKREMLPLQHLLRLRFAFITRRRKKSVSMRSSWVIFR